MALDTDKYMEEKSEEAKKIVRILLLLQAIAKKEKIEVAEEDLNREIERMAEETGRKPLAVRAALEARKELDSVKDDILFTKVTDLFLESTKVKKV